MNVIKRILYTNKKMGQQLFIYKPALPTGGILNGTYGKKARVS
jgi:hypothetical protein